MLCIDYVEVHRAEGETSERRHANFGCNRPRAKRAATDRQSHHSSAGNIETVLDLSADYVYPTLRRLTHSDGCDARQLLLITMSLLQRATTARNTQVCESHVFLSEATCSLP